MNTPSPSARTYKLLGYLALAHAVAVSALTSVVIGGLTSEHEWLLRLWVGSVTLWFLWPIVLALHRGRSVLRGLLFVFLGALLLLPSLQFYDWLAPEALGLPRAISMNPISVWKYYSAYRDGRAEAQKDVAAGILAIEEYGLPDPGSGHYARIVRERYQIEIKGVAGCVVNESIAGHAAGYNEVSELQIDRRVGRARLETAREEGYQLAMQQRARAEQFSKDLARRISSLPPDAKIMAESIKPYLDQQPLDDPAAEEELALLVHAIETYLVERVPKDAPPFKLYVFAKATATSGPSFEVSSPDFPPRPVWKNIYENLHTVAAPKWTRGPLTVGLDFVIR